MAEFVISIQLEATGEQAIRQKLEGIKREAQKAGEIPLAPPGNGQPAATGGVSPPVQAAQASTAAAAPVQPPVTARRTAESDAAYIRRLGSQTSEDALMRLKTYRLQPSQAVAAMNSAEQIAHEVGGVSSLQALPVAMAGGLGGARNREILSRYSANIGADVQARAWQLMQENPMTREQAIMQAVREQNTATRIGQARARTPLAQQGRLNQLAEANMASGMTEQQAFSAAGQTLAQERGILNQLPEGVRAGVRRGAERMVARGESGSLIEAEREAARAYKAAARSREQRTREEERAAKEAIGAELGSARRTSTQEARRRDQLAGTQSAQAKDLQRAQVALGRAPVSERDAIMREATALQEETALGGQTIGQAQAVEEVMRRRQQRSRFGGLHTPVMRMGMFMNLLFGGYELGGAMNALDMARGSQLLADGDDARFAALNQGIQGATGGILGQAVGSVLDLYGGGPATFNFWQKLGEKQTALNQQIITTSVSQPFLNAQSQLAGVGGNVASAKMALLQAQSSQRVNSANAAIAIRQKQNDVAADQQQMRDAQFSLSKATGTLLTTTAGGAGVGTTFGPVGTLVGGIGGAVAGVALDVGQYVSAGNKQQEAAAALAAHQQELQLLQKQQRQGAQVDANAVMAAQLGVRQAQGQFASQSIQLQGQARSLGLAVSGQNFAAQMASIDADYQSQLTLLRASGVPSARREQELADVHAGRQRLLIRQTGIANMNAATAMSANTTAALAQAAGMPWLGQIAQADTQLANFNRSFDPSARNAAFLRNAAQGQHDAQVMLANSQWQSTFQAFADTHAANQQRLGGFGLTASLMDMQGALNRTVQAQTAAATAARIQNSPDFQRLIADETEATRDQQALHLRQFQTQVGGLRLGQATTLDQLNANLNRDPIGSTIAGIVGDTRQQLFSLSRQGRGGTDAFKNAKQIGIKSLELYRMDVDQSYEARTVSPFINPDALGIPFSADNVNKKVQSAIDQINKDNGKGVDISIPEPVIQQLSQALGAAVVQGLQQMIAQ